ncbi:hypothetical protein PIB30_043218 [Stylosanthes scabra]|uniref:Uncharacterized protein n=1 Tax=Stylosanthes scabra TaxID=79078 RepID=A0ABU6QG75_9FABA|nr:hypothetical protein [Stylosanthes scabra]
MANSGTWQLEIRGWRQHHVPNLLNIFCSASTFPFATAPPSAPLLSPVTVSLTFSDLCDLVAAKTTVDVGSPSASASKARSGGSGSGRYTASVSVVPRAASMLVFGAFKSTSPISASGKNLWI